MRVAFVSLFTTHHGETPARVRTRRTARLLAERGHEVTWLCAAWWDGDHGTFSADGITYRGVVPEPSPTRFAVKLPFALRQADPEVVHVVNSPPGAAISSQIAGTLLRRPVVVDWWGNRMDDSPASYRRVASGADATITPSRTVKTQIREYGADGETVQVIPESIDFDLVKSAPVDDRFDVVYSRRLDRHANVETFLLGLAELRDRDWEAAIVGDGPERAAIEQAASDLRIDDRVTFLGETPIDERVSIFKGAHAIARTATQEAFATDLLWALACGCVGLVEYQAGSSAHEVVEGRDRGRLVTSPQEFATAFLEASERRHEPVDEEFAQYDHGEVLESYLDCYHAQLTE